MSRHIVLTCETSLGPLISDLMKTYRLSQQYFILNAVDDNGWWLRRKRQNAAQELRRASRSGARCRQSERMVRGVSDCVRKALPNQAQCTIHYRSLRSICSNSTDNCGYITVLGEIEAIIASWTCLQSVFHGAQVLVGNGAAAKFYGVHARIREP